VSTLREGLASRGVGHSECVPGSWVNGSIAACLCVKHPVCSRTQSLARSQAELIRDRRRRAAVALRNLTSHRVELSIEGNPGGGLYVDGE